MKKLSKVEKTIIAISNPEEYNMYVCPEHGVFANRKDKDNHSCLCCKKVCPPLENAAQLHAKYKEELGY